MPPRKKALPGRGFYFSESEYKENAATNMYRIGIYACNDNGFWYRNGEGITTGEVPGDLWPVRMVQK